MGWSSTETQDIFRSFSYRYPILSLILSQVYSLSSLCANSVFANSPIIKIYFNPQISTHGHFLVTHGTCRSVKNLSVLMHVFPTEVEKGGALPCFSSHTISNCPRQSTQWHIFHLFCFLLVISLLKLAPEHNAEVPPKAPKCKEAVTCLRTKYVSHELFRREL